MVNANEMYRRYKMIRDCVNPKKCKRVPLVEVRCRVRDKLSFVSSLCNLSEEEIFFTIDYCEEHFPALK